MTVGKDTYMGMAVPLYGDSEIIGRTAATDILTITQPGGATGSPLLIRSSAGTTIFSINASGDIAGALQCSSSLTVATGFTLTAGDATITAGDVVISAAYLRFSTIPATAPTTGLTIGDVFLMKTSTYHQIAICTSTAANGLRYVNTTSA